MFAKTIIDSDAFLEMPQSSQLLYFHLSMRADDDGFINKPRAIMSMVGCKDDDLKILFAKKFVIPFESGIVVIKHWRINNYIRSDRYHETAYKDEKSTLLIEDNGAYKRVGIPCGNQLVGNRDTEYRDTEVRLELGKVKGIDISNDISCPASQPDDRPKKEKAVFEHESNPYKLAAKLDEMIHANNPDAKQKTEADLQRWAKSFDLMIRIDKRTPRQIYDVMFFSQNDSFWRLNILSPDKLRQQYDRLKMKMEDGK